MPTGGWCNDGTGPDLIGPDDFYRLPEGQYVPEIMGEWFWQGVDPEILGGWAEQREFDFDPGDVMMNEILIKQATSQKAY